MRAFTLLLALLCLPAQAAAMPVPVREVTQQADDDPTRALQVAEAQAAAAAARGTVADRFWWAISRSQLLARLERATEAAQAAGQAAELLPAWPQAPEEARLWLQLAQLGAASSARDSRELLPETAALRERADAIGLPWLSCEARNQEVWLLLDMRSQDEAWSAAEAVERCGQGLGWLEQQASAHLTFGILTRQRVADGEIGLKPEQHLDRALALLGDRPARFLRSLVAWEAGIALRHQKRPEAGLERLRQARDLSTDLHDAAGVAAAGMEMAAVLLDLGRPAEMLPLLDDAARRIGAGGEDDAAMRMPRLMELRVLALAKLGRPQVLEAVTVARRWLERDPSPLSRARLQRAMAQGLATQGRHAEAYALLEAAQTSEQEGRASARDAQVVRLQARYDNARRDAENAALKLRHEAARLELQTETERNRALVAGIVALGLLAVVALAFGGRELARRRRMADLALRDELTGLPNRRAVQVYAAEQFAQSVRLDLPIAIALIDFDHFKQVNDRFGHAAGDAVLRAFAQAAPAVLRGQDRIGRWGGEEWLLVMPGTRQAEVEGVFERLRERFAITLVPGVPAGLRCTFSMGAAERRPGDSLDLMIEAADQALYRAKQAGRDRLESAPLAVAA